jgi:hypothetical protein
MQVTVKVYSQEFTPNGERDAFCILPEESLWQLAFGDYQGEGRVFLRLSSQDNTRSWIGPMSHFIARHPLMAQEADTNQHNIFLPLWMMDSAGFREPGEILTCDILMNEAFPNATKIGLRVIDSAFYNGDIRSELTQALTKIGVLKKHTSIQIPVDFLDNFPVELFITNLEPADCVLCDGEEVVIEFEEPVDQVLPPTRPPTPVPREPETLASEADTMIPVTPPVRTRNGFVPFQGEGKLLGGSNANIPEWRRQLGPPRQP